MSSGFSTASNPAGVWSYGWVESLGGPFTLLSYEKNIYSDNGVPISAWQVSDPEQPSVVRVMGSSTAISASGAFTAAPGTVYFAPGEDGTPRNFAVIRLTVPAGGDGDYQIETSVRSEFDGAVSSDCDFHVVKNGQELFGRFLPPNSGTGYTNTIHLSAGDTIDFDVGRGQDPARLNAGLKIQATVERTNPSNPPPIYDVSSGFSTASNPAGVWSYGWVESLGGPFTLLSYEKNLYSDNGVPISAWQVSDPEQPSVARVMGSSTAISAGGAFTAAPGTVYFSPGEDGTPRNFAVIRLTVPAGGDGDYRVETSVRSEFDGAASSDCDFHVVKNGQELFGRFLPPNSGTGYTNTIHLSAGDTIDFDVGRGQDPARLNAGLKIQATVERTNPSNPPPIYDVSSGFSTASNPAGVWSYGWVESLGGPFTLLSYEKNLFSNNGVPISAWQVSDPEQPSVVRVMGSSTAISAGGAFTAAPGTVYFSPGEDGTPRNFAVIRLTVPAGGDGDYRIETSVRSEFDGAVSSDCDFHVVKNGQELFGRFLPPNSGTGYTNTIHLSAGDTIDFDVGRGQDPARLNAGLKIQARLYSTSCVTPSSGLVSWWKGEGNALDSVGANHGVAENGTGFAAGEVGDGFNLDGLDDYVLVNASPSLDVGLGAGFTIEGWINPDHIDIQMPIAEYERALGTFDGGDVGVHFYINVPPGGGTGPGSFYANVKDRSGGDHQMNSPPNLIVSGTWQHVALSYDKSSGIAMIHLNGALAAQTSLGSFTPQTSFNLVLGARTTFGSATSPSDRFSGKLDELSLYSRALTQSEIQSIFNAGRAGKCLASANHAPLADVSATPVLVISLNNSNAAAVLDGSKSSDPDGDPLQYFWFESASGQTVATGVVAVVRLPVGTNAITLRVTDGLALSEASLNIEVITTAQAIDRLLAVVNADVSKQQPLLAALSAALRAINRSDPIAAVNQLQAFENQVRAQIAPLDSTLAGTLVDSAQAIIDALQGSGGKPGKMTALANRTERKLHLQFLASRGPLYIIERSANLAQWEKIGVATDLNNGSFEFDDPDPAQPAPRFYRVVVP